MGVPAGIDVDEAMVRALLREQHPDLADRPVTLLANGWDNVLFRLGDDLTVRLPRRVEGAPLVEHEQRWLPTVVAGLPEPPDGLATPVPTRVGVPGCGYPWRWSICPWLPGGPAADAELADPTADAARLGAFLRGIHRPAPADAPVNLFRGVPLDDRAERFEEQLRQYASWDPSVDVDRVRARWVELLATPAWSGPPLWIHGDVHSRNLLVDAGRLSALIDFGDLTAGDPATDLAVAWLLFDPPAREAFLAATGHDADTCRRGEGWALIFAIAYLAVPGTPMEDVGHTTLATLLP